MVISVVVTSSSRYQSLAGVLVEVGLYRNVMGPVGYVAPSLGLLIRVCTVGGIIINDAG